MPPLPSFLRTAPRPWLLAATHKRLVLSAVRHHIRLRKTQIPLMLIEPRLHRAGLTFLGRLLTAKFGGERVHFALDPRSFRSWHLRRAQVGTSRRPQLGSRDTKNWAASADPIRSSFVLTLHFLPRFKKLLSICTYSHIVCQVQRVKNHPPTGRCTVVMLRLEPINTLLTISIEVNRRLTENYYF